MTTNLRAPGYRRTADQPRRRDSVGLLTELRNLVRHARETDRDPEMGSKTGSRYWADKARRYEAWLRWVGAVLDVGRKRKGKRT